MSRLLVLPSSLPEILWRNSTRISGRPYQSLFLTRAYESVTAKGILAHQLTTTIDHFYLSATRQHKGEGTQEGGGWRRRGKSWKSSQSTPFIRPDSNVGHQDELGVGATEWGSTLGVIGPGNTRKPLSMAVLASDDGHQGRLGAKDLRVTKMTSCCKSTASICCRDGSRALDSTLRLSAVNMSECYCRPSTIV